RPPDRFRKDKHPEGVPDTNSATPSGSNTIARPIRGYRYRSTPGYYLAALRAAVAATPLLTHPATASAARPRWPRATLKFPTAKLPTTATPTLRLATAHVVRRVPAQSPTAHR